MNQLVKFDIPALKKDLSGQEKKIAVSFYPFTLVGSLGPIGEF